MDKGIWIEISVLKAIICAAFLLLEGIRDLRRREISPVSCAILIICGVFLQLCRHELSWGSVLTGAMVGIVLLGLSWLSKESIGYGDGLVMTSIGVLFGGAKTIQLFCYALFICGLFSAGVFLLKKAGRKSRIPFIPFLIPAYCVMMVTEVMGSR